MSTSQIISFPEAPCAEICINLALQFTSSSRRTPTAPPANGRCDPSSAHLNEREMENKHQDSEEEKERGSGKMERKAEYAPLFRPLRSPGWCGYSQGRSETTSRRTQTLFHLNYYKKSRERTQILLVLFCFALNATTSSIHLESFFIFIRW